MGKARRVLSDGELLAYSKEHVFYEVMMLVESAELLAYRIDTPSGPMEPPFWNCAIESFAIHVRNVVDFLYPRTIWPTDVLADDFFSGCLRPHGFPLLSPALQRARTRADKQVSHLTTDRLAGAHPEKVWNCSELLREMFAVLSIFSKKSAPTKLHADVTDFIARMSRDFAKGPAASPPID